MEHQLSQATSNVATLLEQIQAEYESGRRGLTGFASGSATHAFITARMERMGRLHMELQGLVGEHDAIALVVHALENAPSTSNEAR